jgi:thiamine-phosphate pyrophosphorylase
VAAVLVDQVALAKRTGADGVHLSSGDDVLERMAAARKALGDRVIVGAACGGSRHLAMEIGEAGADYVAFDAVDEPPPATDTDLEQDDDVEPPMMRADLVAWWSQTFEVPCLVLDIAIDDDDALAAAGAHDFLAWSWDAGLSLADGVTALGDLAERMSEAEIDA